MGWNFLIFYQQNIIVKHVEVSRFKKIIENELEEWNRIKKENISDQNQISNI